MSSLMSSLWEIKAPGREMMRISADYERITFTLVEPPVTFTWAELEAFLKAHLPPQSVGNEGERR